MTHAFLPSPPLSITPRTHSTPRSRSTPRCSSTTPPPPAYNLAPGEIPVRFINTPSGNDVIAAALPGDSLLAVSDSVSVSIPRACRTGLCATCTCDLQHPSFENGAQTVRACQINVFLPENALELVVDVARMKNFRNRMGDPMARFENLDTDYVAGAPPRSRGSSFAMVDCATCDATGLVECYNCDAVGYLDDDPTTVCPLCSGTKVLRCADCQGSGVRQVAIST